MFIDFISKEALPLTNVHRKTLQEQVVDDNQPGTILRDATAMLGFIGDSGRPVTNSNKWLTAKSLGPLNDLMTRPMRLSNLTHPQQKSYSNIHGLYMVLRCSGLLRIIKDGSRVLLVVDPKMQELWASLNPTERYFSLLGAWLLNGGDEVIGFEFVFRDLSPLYKISRFVHAFPADGADVTNFRNFDNDLRFNIGLHHMALLEMFDLVDIQLDVSSTAKGWVIEKVTCTPYGDALLRLLAPLETAPEAEQSANDTATCIRSVVQPMFPDLRHVLTLPVHEFQDGVYVFTVSLGKSWRRIAIPGRLTFERLSDVILLAFEFDDNHLYRFRFRDSLGFERHIDHPFLEDDAPSTTEVAIGDTPLAPGSIMTYQYDFGDDWEFEIVLDTIQPPDPTLKKPKMLEQFGKAPTQYPDYDGEED